MMDQHDYSFEPNDQEEGSKVSLSSVPPFLKASMIVVVGLIVMQVINVMTVGISLIVFYPIQLVIYLGNGALAAHFAKQEGFDDVWVQQGALAGLTFGIIEWVIYAILISVLGAITLGLGWFTGGIACLICGPLDILVAVGLGAFGALLLGWITGTKSKEPWNGDDYSYYD